MGRSALVVIEESPTGRTLFQNDLFIFTPLRPVDTGKATSECKGDFTITLGSPVLVFLLSLLIGLSEKYEAVTWSKPSYWIAKDTHSKGRTLSDLGSRPTSATLARSVKRLDYDAASKAYILLPSSLLRQDSAER